MGRQVGSKYAGKKAGTLKGSKGKRRAGYKPDVLTNPDERGDAVFGAIYGALKPLDECALHFESIWGNDRLLSLVTPETASKFQAVQERLNAAVDRADVNAVRHEAGILYRGWHALDAEARRVGAQPLPTRVYDMTTDSDRKIRVCLTDEDRAGVVAHTPKEDNVTVLSIEELLRIWEHSSLDLIREVKKHFPGARVASVTPKGDAEKNAEGLELFETGAAQGLDDPIPFGVVE